MISLAWQPMGVESDPQLVLDFLWCLVHPWNVRESTPTST